MNVLVVGTGSIGIRHIQNLLSLGVQVSAYAHREERALDIKDQYHIPVYTSLSEAFADRPDAVVIANRTDQHVSTARAAAERGCAIFIEKPLSHTLADVDALTDLIAGRQLVVEIGCMMRFHPLLKFIKQHIEDGLVGKPYLVRVWVGQYLPDWRPGRDYRTTYSARREQGGGVVLDLIHEIDYLSWLFGPVREVSAFVDRVSDLEINTEDAAHIELRFTSGVMAQVAMDYVSPVYRRGFELVGSKGVITWDYPHGAVTVEIANELPVVTEQPPTFQRNDMFLEHMKYFLERVERNGGSPAVSFADGVQSLQTVVAIYRAAQERRTVSL